ncbi:MAG: tetratricopeptide repeat protein [Cytophagales bacterium]
MFPIRLSLSVLFFPIISIWSQNSAVTNASIYQQEGKLKEAKDEIDKASVNEKTINDPKTYYYKGVIYSDIFRSADPAVKMLCDSANVVSIHSFNKCKQLENKEKGLYTKMMKDYVENIWAASINEGVKNFDSKNFKLAKINFEAASQAKPTDSLAEKNVLIACQQLKDTLCLINSYKKLIDKGQEKAEYYYWSYFYYSKRDTTLSKKMLETGLQKFPTNKIFSINYIEDMLAAKKYSNAEPYLNKAISQDPTNKLLRLKYAIVLENLNKYNEAISQYDEVLKIDTKSTTAFYNAGVLSYKNALKFLKEKDNVKPEERETKGKEIDNSYKLSLNNASKYFEEYRKLRPKDDEVRRVLIEIYERLKRRDLVDKIKSENP